MNDIVRVRIDSKTAAQPKTLRLDLRLTLSFSNAEPSGRVPSAADFERISTLSHTKAVEDGPFLRVFEDFRNKFNKALLVRKGTERFIYLILFDLHSPGMQPNRLIFDRQDVQWVVAREKNADNPVENRIFNSAYHALPTVVEFNLWCMRFTTFDNFWPLNGKLGTNTAGDCDEFPVSLLQHFPRRAAMAPVPEDLVSKLGSKNNKEIEEWNSHVEEAPCS